MKSLLLFPALCFFILACSNKTPPQQAAAEANQSQPNLKEVWASDTLLRTPESVMYDKSSNIIYVANVNMNPWEKDGNGFISQLDMRGNIIALEWVSGLNGPKGMGIMGGSLFVADIDEIVEINIATAKVVNRFMVEGTPTLNDISIRDEVIYVSGSDSNKIFMLKDGQVTILLEGALGRPNGLFAESDRLLMITSNSSKLESINPITKDRTVLAEGFGHGDGIVPVGNGDYLASSWRGEIFYVTSDWQRTSLLTTEAAEINAADIDYIIDKNLLLVPTFFDNRVVAYKLVD